MESTNVDRKVDTPREDSARYHPPGMSDVDSTTQLLARSRAGDGAALETLFARHAGPLRRWARGRMPQWARDIADTEDLVQDTLLQTFKHIGGFEPQTEQALQGYLRQAFMNRVRDELRRHARRPTPTVLDDDLPTQGASPAEDAMAIETMERYEEALQRLPVADRDTIIGRVEMGLSYEELAVFLAKPTKDAARKSAQRALVRLAKEMGHGR